jgi:hypothetical protein
MAEEVDERAPHGRDEQGMPLAPYGYKANGDPRLSNRGRSAANAGPKVAAPPKKPASGGGGKPASKKARTRAETREKLLGLADLLTTPLAAASQSVWVRERLGEKQAVALAGDAVILDACAGDIVDGVIAYADHKPGLLAWMDKAEELAPSWALIQALGKVTVALAKNHASPDPKLAAGARSMLGVKALAHAREMQRIESEMLAAAEAEQADIERRTAALVPEQRAA